MKTRIVLFAALTLELMGADIHAQTANYYSNTAYFLVGIYGTDNVGLGTRALNTTGTGPFNTATGYESLYNNGPGTENTADGCQALYWNFVGNNNTATGYQALYNNGCASCGSGNNNTATGYRALYNNTGGDENTAHGNSALLSNTLGRFNTAEGAFALRDNDSWNGVNGEENTAVGYSALANNLDGSQNTAVGSEALLSTEHGNENTALGAGALKDNTAYFTNMIVQNTAAGYNALRYNQNGYGNTACGSSALEQNVSGVYNVAIGYNAHYASNSGQWNVSIGGYAGANNSTETGNVAVGNGALYLNGSGEGNTAVGLSALGNATSGDYNTALGWESMNSTSLVGDHNTCLGARAELGGSGLRSNATAVGCSAIVNANNKFRLGNALTTVVETQTSWSTVSDGRFKYNVKTEDVVGLEFIKRLRPVVYNWDSKKYIEFLTKYAEKDQRNPIAAAAIKGAKITPLYTDENMQKVSQIRQSGFIAQEVEQAAKEVGYDFNGVVKPTNEGDNYGIAYGIIVVPLVKAVQEQQAMIVAQQKKNEQLKKDLEQQTETLNNLLQSAEKTAGIANLKSLNNGFRMDAVPNPFSQETVINYTLPETAGNAVLVISDLSGKQVATYPITVKGSSSLVLTSEKLQEGMYIYSMVVDGKLMGSKRLVVTSR